MSSMTLKYLYKPTSMVSLMISPPIEELEDDDGDSLSSSSPTLIIKHVESLQNNSYSVDSKKSSHFSNKLNIKCRQSSTTVNTVRDNFDMEDDDGDGNSEGEPKLIICETKSLSSQKPTLPPQQKDLNTYNILPETDETDKSFDSFHTRNNWLWNSLDSDDELKVAVEDKKNEEMNWLCGLCYDSYHTEDELEVHMKAVHIYGSRFQKCQFCDRKFFTRFLCLRHEKLHKFDMNRPFSHYFPPKGKPKDYFVSNHFSEARKPAELSDRYRTYLIALVDRLANQKYECLECEKVFPDEELLREHFDVNHALQQCIFCYEYFENFSLLQTHQSKVHEYEYQTRKPGGSWVAWEQEHCAAQSYNQLMLANISFFHNYTKSPNEEPVQNNVSEKPVHLRKAIFPINNTSKLPIKKSIDVIANEFSKNKIQNRFKQGRSIHQIRPYRKTPPGATVSSATKISTTNKVVASQLSTKIVQKMPFISYPFDRPKSFPEPHTFICKELPTQSVENSVAHEKVASCPERVALAPSYTKISPSLEIITPPPHKISTQPKLPVIEQSQGSKTSHSIIKVAENLPRPPPLQPKPLLPSLVPPVQPEHKDLNFPDLKLPASPYQEATSPINESEFAEYESDSSYLSDTPPKLDPMTTLEEEEAMDPEEEGFTELFPTQEDDASGGMLIIEEHVDDEANSRSNKCHICDRRYDDSNSMERHMKTHRGGRPFSCQFCGQGFSTHSNRKEHERIHTGEKPYVCPYCQKGFTQISNLKKHISTHKEQNLKCLKCGKQFVKESSLILHQRAHAADRRFRCHICDRAYNYASLLKRHMRIHTGELPYECDMCGMLFHELVSLHYHRKKVHTGERPHKCEVCGRAFILSSDLKKHQNIHNKSNGDTVITPEVSPTKPPRLVRRSKFSDLIPFKKRGKLHNNLRRIRETDSSDQVLIEFENHSQLVENIDTDSKSELKCDDEYSGESFSDEDLDTSSSWLEPEVHMSYVDEKMEFSD